MNPSELNAIVSAITVIIADSTPEIDDLAIIAISINQLGSNLDAIVAQRLLIAKHK